ncbi:MAG: GDP-mannose 4,6-dehydratase [bacterium]
MTKILITGITGFVGSHLAEYILENVPDTTVYGTIRMRSIRDNIKAIEKKIELIESDLRDLSSTKSVIANVKPDIIFHLAAQSFVPTSWHAPAETLTTNIISTLNILEASRTLTSPPKIHLSCSSEEYGLVKEDEVPIKETNPLRPMSPYGVSKVAQDLLGFQYFLSYKIPVYRTRAFNHTGPRRGEVFVTSNFAKQIVQVEMGREKTIKVGNLEAIRDFTDVRDVVKAYWLCVKRCEPGEVYNISSGIGRKIKDILYLLISLSNIEVKIERERNRIRPSDVPILVGDSEKFRARTKWRPEIPLEKTLKDLLDFWRERLK